MNKNDFLTDSTFLNRSVCKKVFNTNKLICFGNEGHTYSWWNLGQMCIFPAISHTPKTNSASFKHALSHSRGMPLCAGEVTKHLHQLIIIIASLVHGGSLQLESHCWASKSCTLSTSFFLFYVRWGTNQISYWRSKEVHGCVRASSLSTFWAFYFIWLMFSKPSHV